MSQETGVWDQERDEQHQYKRCDPSWYLVCADHKVRIRSIRLDGLHGNESEDPYAAPNN
jgi:hypothetical protein